MKGSSVSIVTDGLGFPAEEILVVLRSVQTTEEV
jgi:hypothetical protein